MPNGFKVVKSDDVGYRFLGRYIVVDEITGTVLDDAQGHGYKSKESAIKSYGYKSYYRLKSKTHDSEIKQWLRANPSFLNELDRCSYEIADGEREDVDEMDAKIIKDLLLHHGLNPPFSSEEIFAVWRKW